MWRAVCSPLRCAGPRFAAMMRRQGCGGEELQEGLITCLKEQPIARAPISHLEIRPKREIKLWFFTLEGEPEAELDLAGSA
jgi:hypothetical protein